MMKRLRWFLLGVAAGLVASVYLRERLRAAARQYAPVRGTVTVLGAIRRVRRDLRDVWADGRATMRSHEARLRAERTAERDRRAVEPVG